MTLTEVEERMRGVLEGREDVRFAVLFGSAVTRELDRARDLDVAVCFSGDASLMGRARLARSLEDATGRGRSVDVVDLGSASTLLRWEVLRDGHVVAAKDARALAEFRARVPLEWADLAPHRARQAAGLRRALGL